jgi:NAD(P)-dependent dehydrogenase (short-subunit alcohol dehydrogenase family)
MSDRCAVVTGGAQNIGRAIAERLRDDGYRVVVLDVIEPEVESFRADARRADLSDRAAAEKVFAEIASDYPVAALINNVGIVAPAPFDDVNVDDFDRIMHLNARTALLAAKAFVPTMRRLGGGRIVMNTSRVTLGKIQRTLYSASKGALQSMARTWALELATDGITVNCVAPGPIATTAFWRNNPPDSAYTRDLVASIPLKRMGTPEDVANAVSFFCSDGASFVTGQTLFVCGGVTVG